MASRFEKQGHSAAPEAKDALTARLVVQVQRVMATIFVVRSEYDRQIISSILRRFFQGRAARP